MDLGRLNNGERVAAVSAILLYVLMGFSWYGIESTNENSGGGLLNLFGGSEPGRNAWEALDLISIVLLIAVLAAVAVAVLRLMDAIHDPPVPVNAVVAALGALSAFLILFRIVVLPDFGTENLGPYGELTFNATVESSMYLALVVAAGIAIGGLLALREEGTYPWA